MADWRNWLTVPAVAHALGLAGTTPAFAEVLSLVVFGAGGAMGLMISGSDTRTAAHYHGMITGVNLACMGLFLKVVLPRIAAGATAHLAARTPILLFGLGQLVAVHRQGWLSPDSVHNSAAITK